jgi:hypothetical protein
MRPEEEDHVRYEESRRWLSEADPTKRREAGSRSGEDIEGEQEGATSLFPFSFSLLLSLSSRWYQHTSPLTSASLPDAATKF